MEKKVGETKILKRGACSVKGQEGVCLKIEGCDPLKNYPFDLPFFNLRMYNWKGAKEVV